MVPTNRQEFKDVCLRKLGAPVIEINVDDDQVDDRIDEALMYYFDYHFDGTEKTYFAYQLQTQDPINRYIPIPDNIIGVINIFPFGDALNTNNIFNIRYQIALNDLYTLTNVQMTPYYMALQNLQFLEQMLVGMQPLRFNRHVGKLYIDMDWSIVQVGEYIIAEAYQVIDPEKYPRVWADRWLLSYAECLIKQQWGQNLKKFKGMKLPGGIEFNGSEIYKEATEERKELEKRMIEDYSIPVTDMIG